MKYKSRVQAVKIINTLLKGRAEENGPINVSLGRNQLVYRN